MATESVDPGDGDTLYAWQVLDHRDGAWGIVALQAPALGESAPLVARSRAVIEDEWHRGVVAWYQQNTGEVMRLAQFRLADVLETIVP